MDVVEQLREAELQAVRSALRDNNVENTLKGLRERGKAQELIRQQYSGRYPFELLQNANDASRSGGAAKGRSAYFLLTNTALIVADDGSGFGDPEIRSICELGDSSKAPGEAIGHKGLGFMSTGEITNRPQIVSTGAEFVFDGQRIRAAVEEILGPIPAHQTFPEYAFPFPLSDEELGEDATTVRKLRADGFSTVIRLPLSDEVKRETVERDLLGHLFPHLLLFLPSIRTIQLEGTTGDFTATVEREPAGIASATTLTYSGKSERWLVYQHEFTPEPDLLEPLGDAWKDLDAIRIAIGVPLDGAHQPKTDVSQPLSVYFPTEAYSGLRVAVHAEWLLTLDRKHVSDTPQAKPLNDRILEEVARYVEQTFAVDLVERFGHSRAAVQSLLPMARSLVTPGAGERLRELWTAALANAAFLPTADGSVRSPAELRLLPAWVPNAATAHQFLEMDLGKMLRADLEGVAEIRTLVASLVAGAEASAGEFAAHLRQVAPEDLRAYYRFLLACRDNSGMTFMRALLKVPAVRTTQGDWVTPSQTPVFLPRGRGETSIPEGIAVPIADLPEGLPELDKFLEDAGVKPFQWDAIIENYLIVVLRDPEAEPDLRHQALDMLRSYNRHRTGGEQPTRLSHVLADALVPARSADGGKRELRRAGSLYFSSAWTGSSDLEILYGPFGEVEFLDVQPPELDDERAEAFRLYQMLGVDSYPHLDEETAGYSSQMHPHRVDPLYWRWHQQPETQSLSTRCPQGHPASQLLSRSTRIDRLADILDSQDRVRLATLWRQLAQHWRIYAPAMTAHFRCRASSHVGPRDRTTESLVAYALRSKPWVPVRRGEKDELVRPAEAWYEAPETPRGLKRHLPLVHDGLRRLPGGEALASFLGLTDAARPEVEDLLTLLSHLAGDADAAGEVTSEVAYAARWVQKRVNDHLLGQVEKHPAPETVRLLSSEDGVKRFASRPAYASDRLLREAWEKRRPVLMADGQLSRLAEYLDLVDLDEEVETIPNATVGPYHPGSEPHHWVRTRIERRKPDILALVAVENPGSDERVERRLRLLEVVCCQQLALHYRWGETEIPRPSAPCFIGRERVRMGSTSRLIGTAYLQLAPGSPRPQPDWHAFSRQLAEFLGVPSLADAIAVIFTATRENRNGILSMHGVGPNDVADARRRLDVTDEAEAEAPDALAGLLPTSLEYGIPAVAVGSASLDASVTAPAIAETQDAEKAPHKEIVLTPLDLPPVDASRVEMVDAKQGAAVSVSRGASGGSGSGARRTSSAPTPAEDQRNRDVGRYGERIALEKERERLMKLGLDPALATWESEHNELASYDISSVDGSQRIYIEVKATTSSDPSDSFLISHNELMLARRKRNQYFIYRVTDTLGEHPKVTRFRDPFGLVESKRGTLELRNARMSLTVAHDEEPDEDESMVSYRPLGA